MTSFDSDETFNVLLGVTGSVATIKAQQVVQALQEVGLKRGRRVVVKVITTERAKHFLTRTERSETFPEINDGTQIARKNETPRNDEEEQEGSESPLEEDVEVLEGCEETEDLSDNGQDSRVQDHAVSGEEKVTDEVRPDYAAVEDTPDRILKSIYDVEEFAEVIDDSKGD